MAWMRSGVRSPSAPPDFFLLLTRALVMSAWFACGEPKVSPAATPNNDAAAPSAATSAPVPSSPAAFCASDADCQTVSSYCRDTPCVCRVLARSEPAPHACTDVKCLVDPCAKKAAACQDGRCALVLASGH
jgi:hypothetical protein